MQTQRLEGGFLLHAPDSQGTPVHSQKCEVEVHAVGPEGTVPLLPAGDFAEPPVSTCSRALESTAQSLSSSATLGALPRTQPFCRTAGVPPSACREWAPRSHAWDSVMFACGTNHMLHAAAQDLSPGVRQGVSTLLAGLGAIMEMCHELSSGQLDAVDALRPCIL